jgi:hypothetical protein
MYLYHVLFTLINIYGVDCQKKLTSVHWPIIFKKNVGMTVSSVHSDAAGHS